jgi:iduronate 2-sulfatase
MKKILRQALIPAGLSLTLLACSDKQQAPEQLNVLFIAVDDLRPELNCYGRPQMISPNIDRLARQGVLFERAYCQQAICMASRASLFTGIYPASNHLYSTNSVESLMPGALTINKHFARAGYDVYGIGKLYHHAEDHHEQFGEWWLSNRTWEGDRTQGRGYLAAADAGQLTDDGRGPAWECVDVADNEYRDGFFADRVVEKLGALKNSEKPFFLGVGFQKPHLPFNAPKKYWDLYDPAEITTAENPYYPVNGSLYGWHNSSELRNYTNIPKGEAPIPIETQKMLIHGYRAAVSYTDAQIGRILDALEQNGLAERTVIILWGDHGWKLGEHGMWIKHTNFELDTRVPMIIAAPGMQRDVKSTAFAEFVDIFPTLSELCGLEIPEHLHGKSLVPVLTDPAQSVREYATSIWPSYRGNRRDKEEAIIGYSVRTDRYRYTEWIRVKTGERLDRELYDHLSDPAENRNVVAEELYAKDLPALEQLVQNHRTQYQKN